MDWYEFIDEVSPSVLKIETPAGHGTGFICHYSQNETLMAIATAKHVIEYADYWQQPIRLLSNNDSLLLQEHERVIFQAASQDSAMILTTKGPDLAPPDDLISLLPPGDQLAVGVEVGWIGYPAIPVIGNPGQHFFSGKISAFNNHDDSYFIDGVAINGVSGGPVFCELGTGDGLKLQIIGSISAYIPNRATGEVFPGLSIAGDLTQLHEMVQQFKNLQEAQETGPSEGGDAQQPDPPEDASSL